MPPPPTSMVDFMYSSSATNKEADVMFAPRFPVRVVIPATANTQLTNNPRSGDVVYKLAALGGTVNIMLD